MKLKREWTSVQQMMFRDKIHKAIKTFDDYFPEEFEKTDIKKCEKCNGSGHWFNLASPLFIQRIRIDKQGRFRQ